MYSRSTQRRLRRERRVFSSFVQAVMDAGAREGKEKARVRISSIAGKFAARLTRI
jgi:hypothetical protein